MIRVRVFVMAGIVVMLGACGQRGDLYMPQEREAVATVPATAVTPAPVNDDDDAQTVQPPATGNATGAPPAPANNN